MRVSFSVSMLLLFTLRIAFAQDTNFTTGPQYLAGAGSSLFARSISTPTLTLAGPPLDVGASNATAALISGATDETALPPEAASLPAINLFPVYYGERPAGTIEVSLPAASNNPVSPSTLPASRLDTGVGQMVTAQTLEERGYGVTLPEAAANQKARSRRATHVYTNADVDRLHGGS